MARDYKSRAQRRKNKASTPIWVWLLSGYIAGVVSVGMAWMKLSNEAAEGDNWIGDRPPVMASRDAAPAVSDLEEDDGLQFDFYSLLSNAEVVVTDDELEQAAARPVVTEPTTDVQKKSAGRAYLIQVGSFKSAKDADAVKARLAFLGMQAKVSKVAVKGTTYHRVAVGPILDTSKVQSTKKQLSNNGYKTLVLAYKP